MYKGMVSCIIPTYKRSETLIRAVNSVLNQTYKNIEVIVVDDNNPNDENSLIVQERLANISDSRLRYIQQKEHINGAVARNVGIKAANGEFIAFLDDDDEWINYKLEKQIKKLNENPDYGGISCLYTFYKNNIPYRKCEPYNDENLHRKVLNRTVSIFTSSVVLRKTCLDESGYFNESLKRHQDLQLLLDFLYNNKILVLNEYLLKINTELGTNRPNVYNFIKIKEDFFKNITKHFELYTKKEQVQIMNAHYFEIILIAIREKNIPIIFKYISKIGINIESYKHLYVRFKSRKNKV